MRKTITRVLVVLAGAVGIGAAVAAPAQASYAECPTNSVCLYDDANGVGLPLIRYQSPGTCNNVPTWFNDHADSFYNRLSFGYHVQFYKDANCSGAVLHQQNNNRSSGPFPSGTADNFLSANGINDRNKLTSIWFNNGFVGPAGFHGTTEAPPFQLVSAQARSLSECPPNSFCGWNNSDFTDLLITKWQAPGTCYTFTSAQNDRLNAFYNRLTKHVQVYKDAGCTGPRLRDWNGSTGPFPPGHSSLFFKPFCCGDGDQNKASSIWINNG